MIPRMTAPLPESAGLAESPTGLRLAAESAPAIWQTVAAELATAAASGRHPFHLLTVATVDASGGPHARTVVLRGFDAPRREVRFHTDVRSPKVEQIGADGRVALHWYDPARRLQIRIAATATIHHGDAIAEAAWQASQPMSRACYTTSEPPGTPLEAVLPAPPPPAADDTSGLTAFAVISCRFESVELLSLHASGHERIRLRLMGAEPTREILAP